ncbi:MAG: hypothetical protein HY563_10315 [Ignavibacteriales bacterium]|nr:hypothetical protein [Ignavibacteriales bacterium]
MSRMVLSILAFNVFMQAFAQEKGSLTYVTDVRPIIQKNCLPCHLEENENPSGFSMDNYELLMKGGKHGSPVVPGKPEVSNMYLKLLPDPPFGRQMPRTRRKLSNEEVQLIYAWIEQGARKE